MLISTFYQFTFLIPFHLPCLLIAFLSFSFGFLFLPPLPFFRSLPPFFSASSPSPDSIFFSFFFFLTFSSYAVFFLPWRHSFLSHPFVLFLSFFLSPFFPRGLAFFIWFPTHSFHFLSASPFFPSFSFLHPPTTLHRRRRHRVFTFSR